jgi:hypothetical protein
MRSAEKCASEEDSWWSAARSAPGNIFRVSGSCGCWSGRRGVIARRKSALAGITSLAAAISAMRRAFRMKIGAYRDRSRDASDVMLKCICEGVNIVLVEKTRALYQFTVPVSTPARYHPSRYCGSRVARAMMQSGAGISRIRHSAR